MIIIITQKKKKQKPISMSKINEIIILHMPWQGILMTKQCVTFTHFKKYVFINIPGKKNIEMN